MKKELKELFIKQIEEILSDFKSVVIGTFKNSTNKSGDFLSSCITRALSVIERIVSRNSEYYKTTEEYFQHDKKIINRFLNVMGSLEALYQDLQKDYLKSLSELIHGDISV